MTNNHHPNPNVLPAGAPNSISLRVLRPEDSLDDLTQLLHRAYKQLAEMGLRFMATSQSVEVTRNRVAQGECIVAERVDRIIGTILFKDAQSTRGCG